MCLKPCLTIPCGFSHCIYEWKPLSLLFFCNFIMYSVFLFFSSAWMGWQFPRRVEWQIFEHKAQSRYHFPFHKLSYSDHLQEERWYISWYIKIGLLNDRKIYAKMFDRTNVSDIHLSFNKPHSHTFHSKLSSIADDSHIRMPLDSPSPHPYPRLFKNKTGMLLKASVSPRALSITGAVEKSWELLHHERIH